MNSLRLFSKRTKPTSFSSSTFSASPSLRSAPPSSLQPSRPSPKALEITEILSCIFAFVSDHILKHTVSRVCRHWYSVSSEFCLHQHFHWPHQWTVTSPNPCCRMTQDQIIQLLLTARQLTYGEKINPQTRTSDHIRLEDLSFGRLLTTCQEILQQVGQDKPRLNLKFLTLYVDNWLFKGDKILSFLNTGGMLQDLTLNLPIRAGAINLKTVLDQCPILLNLKIIADTEMDGSRSRTHGPPGTVILLDNNTSSIARYSSNPTMATTRTTTKVEEGVALSKKKRPLRKLTLGGMIATPQALCSFLPELGCLQDLQLVSLRNWIPPITNSTALEVSTNYSHYGHDSEQLQLQQQQEQQQPTETETRLWSNSESHQMFWEDLAKHCSELDCIHFSTLEFLEFIDFQFPFRLFPREMAWGTKYHIANTTLNELNRQLIGTGDRLTSFELGWPFGQAPTQAATLSDRLSIQMDGILSVFLRRAKHLQHFKVSRDLPISTATLMGDLLKSSTAWACRGLLNLDISLVSSKHEDDKSHDWHGYVFGFLSRVCPRLQALRLQVEGDVLSLKYGLCLLIRLRDLRRLELEVVQPGIYELNALDESDFAWTRDFTGCSSSSSISKSVLTTNRLSRSPFPLFTSSSNSCNEGTGPSTSSSSSAYRDYMTCMERVQRIILFQGEFGPWWKDNSFVDWRQKLDKVRSRKRLEQQKKQQEKNYITDYSKALPVVDGLEFNVCGSYFDMEGCLQAQLSRLSSSEPPLTVYSYQNSSASESDRITKERSVSATPWSNMEQLIIKYKTTNQEPKSISNAKVQAHLDRGQSLLRRLRPDIEVHCVMR